MTTEDDKTQPPAFVTVPREPDGLVSCTCAEYQAAGYCEHVPQHEALELESQVKAIEMTAEAIQLLLAMDDDEERLTALLGQMVLIRRGLVPMVYDN